MRRIVLFIILNLLIVGCSDDSVVTKCDVCSVAYLWSYVEGRSVVIPDDISIEGLIVANDKFGELNNAIVVADDSGGVAVEIDMDNIDDVLPLYSRVRLTCSGLAIACNGAKLILGAEPKGEWVVDRIPESMALNYIHVLSDSNPYISIKHRRIDELSYSDILTLVSIDDIIPIEVERGLRWTNLESGRSVTTVRHFTDGRDTLRVVIDAECQYASEPIPIMPTCLYGILDWYQGDIALRVVNRGIM